MDLRTRNTKQTSIVNSSFNPLAPSTLWNFASSPSTLRSFFSFSLFLSKKGKTLFLIYWNFSLAFLSFFSKCTMWYLFTMERVSKATTYSYHTLERVSILVLFPHERKPFSSTSRTKSIAPHLFISHQFGQDWRHDSRRWMESILGSWKPLLWSIRSHSSYSSRFFFLPFFSIDSQCFLFSFSFEQLLAWKEPFRTKVDIKPLIWTGRTACGSSNRQFQLISSNSRSDIWIQLRTTTTFASTKECPLETLSWVATKANLRPIPYIPHSFFFSQFSFNLWFFFLFLCWEKRSLCREALH